MNETKKHEIPESKHSPEAVAPAPKKDTAKMVWMIVAIVAILALIGSIAYGYMSMKNLNKKISDQQAQINDLENTKKTLQDTASAAATAATNAAAKAIGNAITSSDQQLVEAAKNHYLGMVSVKTVNATVGDKSGDFAKVKVDFGSNGTSREAIFKKVNGTWQFIWGGTQLPGKDIGEAYGLPSGWFEPNQATTEAAH